MKINGKKIEGPNVEVIVFPRSDGEEIVFKAQAVLDLEPFRKLCPEPKPPRMLKRGVGMVEDVEDQGYKLSLEQHAKKRFDWIIVQSLRATDGLEWERVKYAESDSWQFYREELKDSGFGEYEIGKIIQMVLVANSLDESKMEEARKRFLLGQAQGRADFFSQNSERPNIPSGELVNGSASIHQK